MACQRRLRRGLRRGDVALGALGRRVGFLVLCALRFASFMIPLAFLLRLLD